MEDKQPAAGDLTANAAAEATEESKTDDTTVPDESASAATQAATESAEVASDEVDGGATEQKDSEAEDADEAEASSTDAKDGRPRRKLLAGKRLAIAVAVAAVLFVGSAAFAGAAVQPYLGDRATAATKLKVARTAANAITTLWTYTPENMDTLADRAAAYLSGDFEAQYRKFVDAIVAPNKQAKVTNTTSTSPLTKNIPSLKYLSYRLFMKRTNGRWLVTRMTTITSLDLTPHV